MNDLLVIAENFEMRARNLLENYNNSHKHKSIDRYQKMLIGYSTWRDAARVLRGIDAGTITVEKLRKVQ